MMALDRAAFYDAELQRHQAHFRAAIAVGPRDRVLDVGCGAGQSTLEAGRAAVEGQAVGVDVSADMIEVARRRAAEAGLGNVGFEVGDAQAHDFPAARFDLCISRFGTMFFADPAAAFANIGRALRPGARLVMLVWQARERNEWAVAIQQALAPPGAAPASANPAFSLADRAATTRLLAGSGFTSIAFTDVREPVFYGPDVGAAYDAVAGLFLANGGPGATNAASGDVERRLRTMLEAHATADGVLFDSRAWLVTARRP